MKKRDKLLIITIGCLSIISGTYLAVSGSDLIEVIFAFFVGAALIIGVYIQGKPSAQESDKEDK